MKDLSCFKKVHCLKLKFGIITTVLTLSERLYELQNYIVLEYT